ncbi:plastocyanin/azurin family copper-binding protein [Candidatus Nitrosotenuis aquarius]|uniref:plastocyanin/azurin family copper-binding protein n=1 Tax=Candidatus Nitrosotenuis aquarius TaxID=1846278 RepID=UPI000E697F2A|nr:plastocyanin/azurin family copper-binding protein [Candidatus Nitrosotenuis aquarius]
MSNWDLMMPGMGLTAIGLAGVTISYAGIAHTFIDGMHALTGLTMFIGLIFLAAGILDGGVSTSNRAKATTLVVLAISLSFGAAALIFNSITSIPTFIGVMLIVTVPAIVMAYVSMKMPQYAKPIGIIFVIATGAAISAYVGFGLYGPSQYLVPPPEEVEEEKAAAPTAPITSISILKGSAVQGAPDYDPDMATVPAGNNIEWTNDDDVTHTVTSSADAGATFDSGIMNGGAKYLLETSKLQPGTYEYMCIVHPWMTASFVYGGEAPAVPTVEISILKDSAIQGNPDYDPDTVQVTKGDAIVWTNNDSTMHTVTHAGDAPKFDSSIINAGETFKIDTSTLEIGKYDYLCIVHPWMTASFDLVDSSGERLAEGSTATDPNSVPPEEIPVEEAPVEAPVDTPLEIPAEPTTEAPVEAPVEPEAPVEEAPVEETPAETAIVPAELVLVDMAAGTASNTECGDKCFIPNTAYVTVGGTVTWKNSDTAAHTATEVEAKFDSSIVMSGAEYSHTFEEAGTFDYYCIVHPWMKGKVIVG